MVLIRLCEITVCKKSVFSCCLRMYNFIYFYCCHHFIYMYMDVFIRNKLSINQSINSPVGRGFPHGLCLGITSIKAYWIIQPCGPWVPLLRVMSGDNQYKCLLDYTALWAVGSPITGYVWG